MKWSQDIRNTYQVILGSFASLLEIFCEQALEVIPAKLFHYWDNLLLDVIVSSEGKNTSMETTTWTDKPLPRNILYLGVLLKLHSQFWEKPTGPETYHVWFRDKAWLEGIHQKWKDLFCVTCSQKGHYMICVGTEFTVPGDNWIVVTLDALGNDMS